MKKIISLLFIILLISSTFCGCKGGKIKSGRLSVVTTIFPEYDFVMNILGEKSKDADVTMLLDNGVDLHSYQPSADDIIKISSCDLFVYVGGESDKWVDDALKEAVNKDMIVIDLMDVLKESVKEEEIIEGMESEEEETEEDEIEYDEHVWLSLKNSKVIVKAISDALSKLDKKHADMYESNTEEYIKELDRLDGEYKSAVDNATQKTLLFCDRFPFRYMTEDYKIKYYAAFSGCSAESEASFKTISFLAEKINGLKLSSVIVLEGNDGKIADTVISTAKAKNVKILKMDSMQSTTSKDLKKGITYISVMEKNLEVLKSALK